jgi:tetratricopeptide (TPR) repeat protein
MQQHHLQRVMALSLTLIILFLAGCSSMPKHPVKDSDLNIRAASFQKLGNRSFRAGQYDKSTVNFEQALALYASVDDRAGVSRTLSALGRVDLAQGKSENAAGKFQRALSSADGLQRYDLSAHAFGGLGAVSLQTDDPATALVWIQKGLELPLPDPGTERAVLLHDQGVALHKLRKSDAAESNFHLALAMNEKLQNTLGIAADCYSLAVLMESVHNLKQAEALATRALTYDKLGENPPGIARNLELLGSLAEQNGSTEKAVDFYQRAQLVWLAMGQDDKAAGFDLRISILSK